MQPDSGVRPTPVYVRSRTVLKAKNYAEGSKPLHGPDNRRGVNVAAAGLDEDHRACSAAGFIVEKNAIRLFFRF